MDRSFYNVIESFNMYVWNMFDQAECMRLFDNGYGLGEHIWNKYREILSTNGMEGAPSAFFAYLDKNGLEKLVNRALSKYNGRERI